MSYNLNHLPSESDSGIWILDELHKEDMKKGKNHDTTEVGIIFDELGLSELSPENPLKCFHSLLEPHEGDMMLGFIGLSNWFLDLSKMSRMLVVFRGDMTENELLNTSEKLIENTLKEDHEGHELIIVYYLRPIIQCLVQTYLDFIKNTLNSQNMDFHSLRDFYAMIKTLIGKIDENYDEIFTYDTDHVNHIAQNWRNSSNSEWDEEEASIGSSNFTDLGFRTFLQ